MPHFALHILLAEGVSDAWRHSGAPDPRLDLDQPALRNAFYHGAVGPDMGFFPGGDRLLAAAAHLVGSGDLVRRLAGTARTPDQVAFVYGWITHLRGDILIHPHIDSVAATLAGPDATPADPAQRLHGHIRVELGLDAAYVARYPRLLGFRLRRWFREEDLRWLADAYRSVHGLQVPAATILRAHQQVLRLHGPLLLLERIIAAGRSPRHPLRTALRHTLSVSRTLARSRLGPHSTVAGFLDTVPPDRRLIRTVDRILTAFPASFDTFARLLLSSDANFDLDTGRIATPGRPTAHALEVTRLLAARRTHPQPVHQISA